LAATAAVLANPTSLFINQDGELLFSDSVNHRIRKITPDDVTRLNGGAAIAPDSEAPILAIALTGDGETAVHSLNFTLADLDTATGLSTDDFVELNLYESEDTELDPSDLLVGRLDGDRLNLAGTSHLTASDATPLNAGNKRYYLLTARLAADAVQGHAFTLGFGAGDLSTNTGGRGSQLPALAAQRTLIDIIATQLAFIVPPQGVFSGSPLAIQPSIAGVDAKGRIDTEFTDTLTVSVSGSGILLQAIAVAVEGIASFTNLTYITAIDDEKITFSVDDQAGGLEGDLPASQSSLLNANAINDPPHIDLFSLILKEDELFFIDIKDAISDPDDSLFTLRFVSDHIQARLLEDRLEIFPETDWFGTDFITVIIADPSGLEASDRISVEIRSVNDPPVLSAPATVSFIGGDTLELDLRSLVEDVDHAFAELRWTFTPSQGLSSHLVSPFLRLTTLPTTSGLFSLELKALDPNGASATTTLQVEVMRPNQPPSLDLPAISLFQDSTLVLDLTAFAADPDHPIAALNWSLVDAGPLTIRLNSAGVATLTAPSLFSGPSRAIFRVTDPDGASVNDTLVLNIQHINIAPSLTPFPEFVLVAGDTLQLDLKPFASDPDGSIAALSWQTTTPVQGEVVITDGVLRLTTNPALSYQETLLIEVRDANGLNAAQALTLRVNRPLTLVSGPSDSAIGVEDTLDLSLDIYVPPDFDPASLTWSATADSLLQVVIDQPTRRALIAAADGNKGSGRVEFTATDPDGRQQSIFYAVTILNAPPTLTLPDLFIEAGATHLLSLDDFAQDDESVTRLRWSVRPDVGVQVSINNALRRATLTAAPDFSGLARLVFTITDAQGASAMDTLEVTVRPPPEIAVSAPIIDLPSTRFTSGDTLRIHLDLFVRDDRSLTELVWHAQADPVLSVVIQPTTRIATLTNIAGQKGQRHIVFQATDADSLQSTDTLVVDILNPAPIIDLPGLFLDAGTPARLLLDDFARDDEPVERLHWTAQLVPGLEIEIDNTLRQITILAPHEGQQPISLVLTVRDLQGDTALDTMLVTVHPSIAETDTSVTDTVTIDLPDSTLNDTVIVDLPDSTLNDTVIVDLPDSTLNDTVIVDLPDSTLNDTVIVDLPDSTLNDTVIVDLPDSTLNDTVVVDLPDSTLNDTVVVDLPDSTLNDTVVVDLPDSTLNDTVVVDLPDSISTDTTFTRPDTLPARINQTPRLFSVPNLEFSSGASIRLVLDRYVFDDAPLNALTWSAAADSSLQVEIDPLRRIATIQATDGFVGQSRIRFTVFDSEGAGISFFANVGVIPPPEPLNPADFSADGRLTVDDFFFFADHFGLNSLHPSWDPRFDLDKDGQITLQDFLEFADLYQHNQDTLSRSR
jgi:hypothetical protein